MFIKLLKLSYLSVFFIVFDKNINATEISPSNTESYQESSNGTLQALNKITGQVTSISAKINQSITFGKITIKLLRCLKKKPELTPDSLAFIMIHENVDQESPMTIFSGWMFASTPSISALEHPIYDVWIKECHALPLTTSPTQKKMTLHMHTDQNTPQSLESTQIPIDTSETSKDNHLDDPIQALCEGLDDTN